MQIKLSNGESLFYRKREGGEKVLLLLHGNLASSNQWDLLMEHLPVDYTIYAPDLRGYGNSTYHKPIETFDDFVMDIKLFCDELNLDKFYVMGWSNGGGIAMQFAAKFPSQVEKLILLASISTRGFPALNASGERLRSRKEIASDPIINSMLHAQKNGEKEFFEAAMSHLMYSNNKPERARLEKYVEGALNQRNMVDVADAANRFNISSVPNGVSQGTGEVAQLRCPVLVLWGKHDQITLEPMTLEIVNDMKAHDIDLVYKVLDAGHNPFVENIQKVVSEIHDFLS